MDKEKVYIIIENSINIFHRRMKSASEAYFQMLAYSTNEEDYKERGTQRVYISENLPTKRQKRILSLTDDDLISTRSDFIYKMKNSHKKF